MKGNCSMARRLSTLIGTIRLEKPHIYCNVLKRADSKYGDKDGHVRSHSSVLDCPLQQTTERFLHHGDGLITANMQPTKNVSI